MSRKEKQWNKHIWLQSCSSKYAMNKKYEYKDLEMLMYEVSYLTHALAYLS